MSVLSSGSAVVNFVDLCTLANTSIIVVKEQMFGYYIHGKAPWGQSDIPLEILQKQIFEYTDKNGKRGLEKQNDPRRKQDQVQTFKIFLPYDLLEKLQQIRKELTKDDNDDYEDPNKVQEEDEIANDADPLNGGQKKNNELSTRANEILEEEFKREEIIKTLKSKIASNIDSN